MSDAGPGPGEPWGGPWLGRVAMVSVHTSPLDPPGAGDAGGMNVYVLELARALASAGLDVDVYTRSPGAREVQDVAPADPGTGQARPPGRCRVVALPAGPPGPLAKEDLPPVLADFAARVLEAGLGPYDAVHSHYWLSGEVGRVLAAAWAVPLVHTMHTMAATKAAVGGSGREAPGRADAEARIAAAADALVVSTAGEGDDLRALDGVPGLAVHVVAPGVDVDLFAPGDRDEARARLGLPVGESLVLFVGRVQPYKGPDLLVRALAASVAAGRPAWRAVVLGGPSGDTEPGWLEGIAAGLGVGDRVVRHGPVPRSELPDWYRAADLVAVPSVHETFGLVALEAQASGVPVVASRAGGLVDAVRVGESGVLVEGRDPGVWASAIDGLLAQPAWRPATGERGRVGAASRPWLATATRMRDVYRAAGSTRTARPARPPDRAVLRTRARRVVLDALSAAGVDHAPGVRPGEVVAALPGEHRLSTAVSLLVGDHALSASAFVCRRPDEDEAGVHAWLLRRTARLPGVAFGIDAAGDVHLVGRLPLAAVVAPGGAAAVDDLLGAVAATADDAFDDLLRLGFAGAVRAEYRWRVSRGLPTANLRAFSDLTGDSAGGGPGDGPGADPAGDAAVPGAGGPLPG